MTKLVHFEGEAEEELKAAVDWYETQRPGLGLELLAAVQETIESLEGGSLPFGLDPRYEASLEVRRCPVQRFPYAVVFVDRPEEIRVLAISHGKRRPGYWRGRL